VRIVRLTSSYQIELPEDVKEEQERLVTSFWRDGESLSLQLSSYIRNDGAQVLAKVRLGERMANAAAVWTAMLSRLGSEAVPDEAAAFYKEDGILWLFAYFVWPHLTVLATISGLERDVFDETSWATQALRSLSLIIQ
jgi:hypothetical protein